MLRIGRHVSISGSLDMAFDRARSAGCDTMQVFTGNPRQWSMGRLNDSAIESFTGKREGYGVEPVVAHMPYLPNLANQRDEIYGKSVASLAEQVERCNDLRIDYLVLHLGSRLSMGREKSIDRIAKAVDEQAGLMKGMILLENQAGQLNSMGSAMGELAEIRGRIGSRNVGYCIDTCHAFAAGYDIGREDVLHDIDAVLGIRNIKVLHINDSKFGINEHRDRHENIGKGHIGSAAFGTVLNHYAKTGMPAILETECLNEAQERAEIELVRKLAAAR